MAKHYYNSGEFNLYCDVCAKKIKAHESKLRWDGLRVCTDDWEERQPQDFVRARQDKISIPFSRPVENTSNNISYGMWDRVTLRESNNILSVLFSNDINDYIISLYDAGRNIIDLNVNMDSNFITSAR